MSAGSRNPPIIDAPPALEPGDDVVQMHGEAIPDPFRRVSDLSLPETKTWIQAQDGRYHQYVDNAPGQAATEEALKQILDAPVKGIPTPAGGGYIYYYKGAGDNQPKVMFSDTAEGAGHTIIDPNALDPSGLTSIGDVSISPDGKQVGYLLSKNGQWESELRIRNLDTGEDTLAVERAGHMWWDKDGKGFTYNQKGDNSNGVLKHHALGEDETRDTMVFEEKNARGVYGALQYGNYRNHTSYTGTHDWLLVSRSDSKSSLSVKDPATGDYNQLFDAGVAKYAPIADVDGGVLMWTTRDAPNGKVVKFDPAHPDPAHWQTIVPEGTDALQHAFVRGGKIYGLYTHDCADQVKIFGTDGAAQGEMPLPPQSRVEFSHATIPGTSLGNGAPEAGDMMLSITNFKEPATTYKYDDTANTLSRLDPKPDAPDLSGCIVEQIWVESKDGTKIPMTVVRQPGTTLDGTAALKLTGYGGHGSVMGPRIDAEMIDFVRSGGIYVQANVRGGGEFGEDWHAKGSFLNKPNSFDDFNACAHFLIDNKFTSSPRLVSEGTSTGGLLVLASMEREPSLYGAVIANVPVSDMLGKNVEVWKTEFGDAAGNADDFRNMKEYCPRQNVVEGQSYPPLLVRTGAYDTMLAGDACKFAATMQAASPQSMTLLHVEQEFGHSSARPQPVEIAEMAAKKAFIERSIGPLDQNAYKAQLAAKVGMDDYGRGDAAPSAEIPAASRFGNAPSPKPVEIVTPEAARPALRQTAAATYQK